MNSDADFHLVCDSEPIHVPGSIQPKGVLLVLDANLTIVAASANSAEVLDRNAAELVGLPLAAALGPDAARRLVDELAHPGRVPLRFVTGGSVAGLLEARLHAEAGRWLLDLEPWDPAADRSAEMLRIATAGIASLRSARFPAALADAAARLVRDVTGFDRVLVYRFDEDWNGEVVAESRVETAPSYLGLSFPASDIPPQARELYRRVEVRHIPDAHYTPVSLVSAVSPVDIGSSGLRSVSPFHLVYMRNMGVRASLVGSVMRGDRLWGLVACHHLGGPKPVTGPERDVFHMICQSVSAMLSTVKADALARRRTALEGHQTRLLEAVHDGGIEGLMSGDLVDDLLGVVGADGFVYITDDGVRRVGSTPSPEFVLALRDAVQSRDCGVFASHSIVTDTGLADPEGRVAGMLILPLRGRHDIQLAWFRDERVRTVRWGGDPDRPVDVSNEGMVSPRKSFEAFCRTVQGQSLRWAPEEIESARRLGELIEVEVQRIHRAQSEFLRAALLSLNEMVIVTEAEPLGIPGPRIVMVSEAVETFTGYRTDELVGRTPRVFQGAGTDRAALDRVREALARRQRVQVELLNYRKDGSPFWVELDIAPIVDDTGRNTHWISVQRDISARKKVEEELAAQRDQLRQLADQLLVAKDAADRANEAKSMFLANMSHELRTPMHAIMSFSRLGLDRVAHGDAERLQRYFGNIHESGARLTALLNDLLDLSKLEAGRMELHREPVDVSRVVDDCVSELEPLAAARSLSMSFRAPALPVVANVDPMRIGQVLRNLLSNAIKFSPAGGVIGIVLEVVPDGFRLAVEDEGVGIPEAELESVFDKFVQSSKTRTSEGGTGLGLAICRELATAHGGWICARQRSPRGTLMEMVLPLDGGSDGDVGETTDDRAA